ncbi:hypothetical protein HMI54_007801 [Coelomomyces lativittatus]|nr:hypothetical protein HMI55_002936 [Coelomomyces lativittatus]KAJ1503765.1 hypothetical protein HMI54_007801 [Coelomomyces lativittatus]
MQKVWILPLLLCLMVFFGWADAWHIFNGYDLLNLPRLKNSMRNSTQKANPPPAIEEKPQPKPTLSPCPLSCLDVFNKDQLNTIKIKLTSMEYLNCCKKHRL